MLIVISPAKTLDFTTPSSLKNPTQPQFLARSEQLIETLRGFDPEQLSELMSISPKLGELNWHYNLNWSRPFTRKNAKAAILAFRGDVYRGLDADSFTTADLNYAQKHLRILSGLYGLLRPLDLIQPYRLEMGTALKNRVGGNLYAYWGDDITQALNDDLRQSTEPVLINLASEEYFKAVRPKILAGTVITPHFKERKDNGYKVVSFFAKKARGMMSAYILKNRIREPSAIKRFTMDGYRYNESLSQVADWVFTREAPPD